jgi:hypothetical protein
MIPLFQIGCLPGLRFERRRQWSTLTAPPRLSLLTLLVWVAILACALAMGLSTAWLEMLNSSPLHVRAVVSWFAPIVALTFLLQWAFLSRVRWGAKVAAVAAVYSAFAAVRIASALRIGAPPIDLVIGLSNLIGLFATLSAIFGVCRWSGWRWTWIERQPTPRNELACDLNR